MRLLTKSLFCVSPGCNRFATNLLAMWNALRMLRTRPALHAAVIGPFRTGDSRLRVHNETRKHDCAVAYHSFGAGGQRPDYCDFGDLFELAVLTCSSLPSAVNANTALCIRVTREAAQKSAEFGLAGG